MSAPKPEVWTVAVCLYDHNTTLDFQGAVELFGFLSPAVLEKAPAMLENGESNLNNSKVALDVHYLSISLDPVVADSGPRLVPTDLYSAAKQYDVILVPGGDCRKNKRISKRILNSMF